MFRFPAFFGIIQNGGAVKKQICRKNEIFFEKVLLLFNKFVILHIEQM